MGDLADWFAEREPTKQHEAFGREWTLPADMPAALWIWANDTLYEQNRALNQTTYDEIDAAITTIPGLAKHMRKWAKAGAGRSTIYREALRIIALYLFPPAKGGGASGEASSTSAPSSDATSDSSPPTGPESTAETSEPSSEQD